jgi:RNA polymerase sigma-70 factor (ECF subfamily)
MSSDAIVERTAREAYGRLVAMLAVRNRDIMAAEDALQDAFVAALAQWPVKGVPQNPQAWLHTVARRRMLDTDRRQQLFKNVELDRSGAATSSDPHATETLSDDRLELMLVCAHPAIDAAVHAPLILQTVLGLNAEQIAAAFLVSPTSMGQRLVRAKQKIRDAGMAFELPGPEVLEKRLDSLLDAIYVAYGVAWADLNASGGSHHLTQEAIMLVDAIASRLPEHPETLGLSALMRYTAARKLARRDESGSYVPLKEQDVGSWDRPLIAQAESLLRQAAAKGELGRFQLEAAVQSAHITARLSGKDDPGGLFALYDGLIRIAPSIGALVAHAVASAEVHGPEHAIGLLAAMESPSTDGYQAYHAARAELLQRLGQCEQAHEAYTRAIGLSDAAAVRRYLEGRRSELGSMHLDR